MSGCCCWYNNRSATIIKRERGGGEERECMPGHDYTGGRKKAEVSLTIDRVYNLFRSLGILFFR